MKKLLVLVLVAAGIGFLVSRGRGAEPDARQPEPEAREAEPVEAAPAAPAPTAHPPSFRLEHALSAMRRWSERPAWVEPAARPAEPQPTPAVERVAEQPPAPAPPKSAAPAPARPVVLSAETEAPKPAAARPVPPPQEQSLHAPQVAAALTEATELLEQGKRVEARARLSALYRESRGELARKLREVLDRINADLVFNPRCVDGATIHLVEPGDMYVRLGPRYDVNWRMIRRINGIPDDRLRPGQHLKVLTGVPSIVVWKGEFRLALFIDDAYIREYPIGVGLEERTPTGQFVVEDMVVRAPWTTPEGRVIRYGQEGYQLGERWIGFADQPGAAGLGIHGTNDEASVGTRCSNGCLRMKNDDVTELYDFVRVGTEVEIRG